jgi:hypothetical protein
MLVPERFGRCRAGPVALAQGVDKGAPGPTRAVLDAFLPHGRHYAGQIARGHDDLDLARPERCDRPFRLGGLGERKELHRNQNCLAVPGGCLVGKPLPASRLALRRDTEM